MTNEQSQVKNWMKTFGQEVASKPCIPSLEVRKLRAKLILEECLETIEALGFLVVKGQSSKEVLTLQSYEIDETDIRKPYPKTIEPNLDKIADGCEDLKVVTEGTLVACGLINKTETTDYQVDPLFNEVMRSNNSKMWTFDEIRKAEFILAQEYDLQKGWDQTGTAFCEEISKDKWLVKNKDGKILKSPSYSPPNLAPIIKSMEES
jgi:predicted HAD superfamily Cof-like phosphohydrolase